MTTLRTNMVRYPFATSTADLATNTTLGTATRLTFTAITVTIAETGSRTFLSALARFSFRDRFTVANEITAVRTGCKVGAAAYVDVDRTFTQANTGDHLFDEWTLDITDNLNTNFGAAATQTIELGLAVATTSASNVGGSLTAELLITYQYDDATGTTRTKTIGIPIQSHHTTLTNAQQEIGTTGGTTNAPANQIPALDTYLPEATKAYKAIYAVSTANDASTTTSDITPWIQIDSVAEVARGLIGQALITTMPWRDIFDLLGAGMTTNAVHAFKMRADVTGRMVFAGAIVWVTYTYDKSATTAIINQVIVPFTESGSDSFGQMAGEGFNTTDVQTLYAGLDVQEPGPIALVQSAVIGNLNSGSSTANITIAAGGQAARTLTPIAAGGEEPVVHRGDHSTGWTIARGANRFAIKIANTVSAAARSSFIGYALITYTSGLPAGGACVGNRAVNFSNAVYQTGTLPIATDVAAASQRTPTLVAPYAISGVMVDGRWRGPGGNFAPQLFLAQGAGEFDAAGWVTCPKWQATIGELSSWWFIGAFTRAFNKSSFQTSKLAIETGRRHVLWSEAANANAAWSTWISYHQVTFTVAGTVTINGAAAANGKIVNVYGVNADGNAELAVSVAVAGGAGAFTCQVPDNTRSYFATYDDSGNEGRSITGTPGSSTFNVTIGAAVTPDVTITGQPAVSTTATGATFTFTVAAGTAEASVDGGAFGAQTSPLVLSGLAVGAHSVVIRSASDHTHSQEFDWSVVVGGSSDTTPPSIAIISPTVPGGFPADYATASQTEIVAEITDLAPGNRYICVVARLGGGGAPPAAILEEVVYRRGAFRGAYLALSWSEAITNGIRLHIRRTPGWPGSGTIGDITLELDALDQAGNLAA